MIGSIVKSYAVANIITANRRWVTIKKQYRKNSQEWVITKGGVAICVGIPTNLEEVSYRMSSAIEICDIYNWETHKKVIVPFGYIPLTLKTLIWDTNMNELEQEVYTTWLSHFYPKLR